MRISVVIPTYERPEALKSTVKSVCDQTVEGYDVFVVDDGSESESQREALEYLESNFDRITVLRGENAGPAAARNRGWQSTDADVVLFTDDDCIVPKDWVERLTEGFDPNVGAVGGPLVPAKSVADKPVARLHTFRNRAVYELGDEPVVGDADLPMGGTANIAYRRKALVDVDGFDESFPTAAGEDADLQKRVADEGYQMKYIPVKVKHNDTYDFESFVSRTIRHGKGTYYYHQYHDSPRPMWRVFIGLIAAPLLLPKLASEADDILIASLAILERILLRTGELKASIGRS